MTVGALENRKSEKQPQKRLQVSLYVNLELLNVHETAEGAAVEGYL